MRLVPDSQRRSAPLVLSPSGGCWTKASLDIFFKSLVRAVTTEERARQLSIHSFRVWLACSLLAARATPEQIMLLLRWSSDEARRLYARMGEQQQVNLLDAAAECPLDTVRAHTLYAAASAYAGTPTAAASPEQQAASALEQANTLLQAAQDVTGPLPKACDLPTPIDDDDAALLIAHRRLSRSSSSAFPDVGQQTCSQICSQIFSASCRTTSTPSCIYCVYLVLVAWQ